MTRALVFGLSLALACAGCERGCLSSWLADRGAGPSGASSTGAAWSGVDCPDGLARCADGVVEVSKFARVPSPCTGSPERCACPWVREGTCPGRCSAEHVQRVVPKADAVAQLCAPTLDAATPYRPALPGTVPPAGGCEGERYRCAGGVVVSCGTGGEARRAVAVCSRGCVTEGDEIEDDVSDLAAAELLCRR